VIESKPVSCLPILRVGSCIPINVDISLVSLKAVEHDLLDDGNALSAKGLPAPRECRDADGARLFR
jgi:hypothetical protein